MRRLPIVLLALLGLAALLAGIGMRTIWLPPSTISASVTVRNASPVIVTAPGLLEMYPGTATVTVRGEPGQQILIARGREQDVTEFLKGAQADTLVGLSEPGVLAVRAGAGGEPLPGLGQADLWLDSTTQTDEANYVWREGPGRFQLVIATDGQAAAPGQITLTWPQGAATPWAVPLMVTGILLLLVAVVSAAGLVVRSRRAAARDLRIGTAAPTGAPGTGTEEDGAGEHPAGADQAGADRPGEHTETVPAVDEQATETLDPVDSGPYTRRLDLSEDWDRADLAADPPTEPRSGPDDPPGDEVTDPLRKEGH